jgi:hypothetical protein
VKSDEIGSIEKRRRSQGKKGKKILAPFSSAATNQTKSSRGRKRMLPQDTVTGRASNYERELNEVWENLEIPLLNSKNPHDVTEAFKKFAGYCAVDFVPTLSSDIYSLLNDPQFPQRALPRTRFLARSLAGRPKLSFRRSRDICEEADREEKRKSPHRILRKEYYIECSCGYRGPAFNDGCRKCGAQPEPSLENWTGEALEIYTAKPERKIRKTPQPEPHQEAAIPANPNTVWCECGASIGASSREIALELLDKHRRDEHPEIANQPTEGPPE